MKRSPLNRGDKPLQRKTALSQGSGLRRTELRSSGLKQDRSEGGVVVGKRSSLKQGKGFAASPAQQKKARTEPCVVTGEEAITGAVIDPAHLAARGGPAAGCDSELCTVPLRRDVHEAFDRGDFDLLPYLRGSRVPELCHALEHCEGDILGLLRRLTGDRYVPAGDLGRAA